MKISNSPMPRNPGENGFFFLSDVDFTAVQDIRLNLPGNRRFWIKRVLVEQKATEAMSVAPDVSLVEITPAAVDVQTLMTGTLTTTNANGTLENVAVSVLATTTPNNDLAFRIGTASDATGDIRNVLVEYVAFQ